MGGAIVGAPLGSRPKISLDDIAVSSIGVGGSRLGIGERFTLCLRAYPGQVDEARGHHVLAVQPLLAPRTAVAHRLDLAVFGRGELNRVRLSFGASHRGGDPHVSARETRNPTRLCVLPTLLENQRQNR